MCVYIYIIIFVNLLQGGRWLYAFGIGLSTYIGI